MTDTLQYIDIKKIKVKNRTREDMKDIPSLAESIKEKGVVVPLILNKNFELKAGGRRYAAATLAGLKQVPCLIRQNADELDGLEIELIENVFREDFTFLEKANHIKKLHDYCTKKNLDWSGRKTAQLLGEARNSVARSLSIAEAAELIPEISQCKTQDEAEKVIKKMHEGILVDEMRRRQETQKNDTGLKDLLKLAKSNYNIGSCFDGMKGMKSNGSIHFIELDPPYAIDLDVAKGGASQRSVHDKTGAETYNEIPRDKYKKFMDDMAMETFRVANPHCWMVCWFGPTHFTLVKDSLEKAGWKVNDIPAIWTKPGGQTAAPEYNLANCYEPFFICRKGMPTLVKRGRRNVFEYAPVPPNDKYHPTQRPIELITEILETFCLPVRTNICLVPCLGSGTTLRAAYNYGVPAFGYDTDDQYLDKFLLAVEQDMRKMNREEA